MNLINQKNLINNKNYIIKINNIKLNFLFLLYVYTNIFKSNLLYILTKFNKIKIKKLDCLQIILQYNFEFLYNCLPLKRIKKKDLILNTKIQNYKKFKYLKKYINIKKIVYDISNNLENNFIQALYIQPRVICLNFTISQNSIIVNGIDVYSLKILFNTSTTQIGFLHLKHNLMYALESLIEYCMDYVLNNNYKNIIIKFKINPFFMHISYLLHIFKDLFLKQNNDINIKFYNTNLNSNLLIKNNYISNLNVYFNVKRMKIFNGCRLKKEKYSKIRKQQQNVQNNPNLFWENFNIVDL